jgi:hypothetical protein
MNSIGIKHPLARWILGGEQAQSRSHVQDESKRHHSPTQCHVFRTSQASYAALPVDMNMPSIPSDAELGGHACHTTS